MEPNENSELRRVVCTGVWGRSHSESFEGKFQRWGEKLNYITGNNSLYGAAEVVAIVEADDGQVYEVPASKVRFLKSQLPTEYDDLVKW